MTDDPTVLHLELPGVTPSVPGGRSAVTRWLEALGAATTEDDRAALRLAVTEALANAVEHGGDGPVTVTATCRHGSAVVVVRDGGRWSGADRTTTPALAPATAERGRGLQLLGAVSDEVQVVCTPAGTATAFVRHVGVPARAHLGAPARAHLGAPARATVPPSDR